MCGLMEGKKFPYRSVVCDQSMCAFASLHGATSSIIGRDPITNECLQAYMFTDSSMNTYVLMLYFLD